MHILILGAAGMIGRKLAVSLAADGHRLTLADVVPPPDLPNSTAITRDLAASAAPDLIAGRPDAIIHLAAIVSGEAEADFDKGYATNLDSARALLEAIRHTPGYAPKMIFASSIAVFGAPFPAKIPDDFFLTPRTSYGTQKAITELLISDYSRRGFIDGISIRLPTICVRPGLPNKAASGFFSNIIREPLVGKPAVLPVPDTTRHWFASPASAVGFFRHALTLDTRLLGDRRALSMPGLSATVAEEIEALRRVAGQDAVNLITRQPDDTIARIVATWPSDFETTRADALGFKAETTFDQIIQAHLKDH
jgi:nucleoside-diphosphate-sugar epimerase